MTQGLAKGGVVEEQGVGRVTVHVGSLVSVWQEGTDVVNSPHFFLLYLFKVMGVDVVPELPEKGIAGVVVDVGLLVGHLEERTKSHRDFNRTDRQMRSLKNSYLINGSLK